MNRRFPESPTPVQIIEFNPKRVNSFAGLEEYFTQRIETSIIPEKNEKLFKENQSQLYKDLSPALK